MEFPNLTAAVAQAVTDEAAAAAAPQTQNAPKRCCHDEGRTVPHYEFVEDVQCADVVDALDAMDGINASTLMDFLILLGTPLRATESERRERRRRRVPVLCRLARTKFATGPSKTAYDDAIKRMLRGRLLVDVGIEERHDPGAGASQ